MSLYECIVFARVYTNPRVGVCGFKVVQALTSHNYARGSIFTKYNQICNISKPFETGFNPHPGLQQETLEALSTNIHKRVDLKL